jgi:hypothetical protein
MTNSTHNLNSLIELRQHYENIIAQSQHQADQAKEQLAHIDALLLNGLLQGEMQTLTAVIAPDQPVLTAAPILDRTPDNRTAQELAEDVEDFLARAKPSRKAKATPEQPILSGNRIPRSLLPAYQGLKRLEAIAQVLQSTSGQEVKIDSLSQALFGDLSVSDRVSERKRLYTLLYKGEKLGLWKKGQTPYSYLVGNSKMAENTQSKSKILEPKAKDFAAKIAIAPHPASAPRGQCSLSLLPAYAGMNKLEAIAQVLTEQSGHVLHQDTIFQLLYGEVSPEILSKESKRMRASLFQGVTKGLWDKSTDQRLSYLDKAISDREPKSTPVAQSPAKSGQKPRASVKVKADEGDRSASPKTASRGRTQVLSLPAQYAGLSKIETVAKVLEENNGTVMHMDEIIEQLYGKLSGEDLKAEKVRMKDVMTRGVQRKLWNKAQGVPSSIVAGEPKSPRAAKAKASTTAKVTQLQPATPKKPRKAASSKATAKPKRKQAEVVALLKKANIKV